MSKILIEVVRIKSFKISDYKLLSDLDAVINKFVINKNGVRILATTGHIHIQYYENIEREASDIKPPENVTVKSW